MIWVPNNFDSSKPLLSPPIQSDVDAQSAIPTVSTFDSAVDKCSGVLGAMGSCASKSPPRKPNPYVSRDASDHLQATPQPRAVRETRRSRSFPSSSPTKKELHGSTKAKGGAVLAVEGEVEIVELDKNFGLSNKFASVFEVGEEIVRGQFGYTCSAIAKKGELKGLKVAVKIIPKSKMTTTVAIEDVRREIKILQTFTEHPNLAQFYGAFEDFDNVYIVMELCRGGELLDKMQARGGRYSEEDAKAVIIQIMKAVAFLHLYGVVHRDIKPENFLFASQDENSQLKVIDFGLSDFVRHDNKLTDTVGSAYYAAPEVLQKSYDTGADVWSVGVIAYIILCGSRPFWAQTDSGIFRAVTEANLNFDENPWPSLSPESKDFVRCLLHGDPRLRVTAAQALCHPWLQQHVKLKVPLDVLIFKLLKAYMKSSYLRKAALRALSKTLTADELYYPKEQFALLYPDERGGITLETIKMALVQNATGATKSHIADLLEPLNALQYRRMYFDEFCAAALNVPQLEALDSWGDRISNAYNIFDQNGNRVIVIEELASELDLSPSMSVHAVLQEWVRQSDGKLTFLGFSKLICRGMPTHQDRLA